MLFQGTAYDRNPSQVGPKTFIDRVAIKTGEKTRVYESDNSGVYERVTTVLDADAHRFVVAPRRAGRERQNGRSGNKIHEPPGAVEVAGGS